MATKLNNACRDASAGRVVEEDDKNHQNAKSKFLKISTRRRGRKQSYHRGYSVEIGFGVRTTKSFPDTFGSVTCLIKVSFGTSIASETARQESPSLPKFHCLVGIQSAVGRPKCTPRHLAAPCPPLLARESCSVQVLRADDAGIVRCTIYTSISH
jgi:hypothetical protein